MAFVHDPDDTCAFGTHHAYNLAMREVHGDSYVDIDKAAFLKLQDASSCGAYGPAPGAGELPPAPSVGGAGFDLDDPMLEGVIAEPVTDPDRRRRPAPGAAAWESIPMPTPDRTPTPPPATVSYTPTWAKTTAVASVVAAVGVMIGLGYLAFGGRKTGAIRRRRR